MLNDIEIFWPLAKIEPITSLNVRIYYIKGQKIKLIKIEKLIKDCENSNNAASE